VCKNGPNPDDLLFRCGAGFTGPLILRLTFLDGLDSGLRALQKVVARLNAKFAEIGIECGLSDNYKEFILETKLEA